MTFYEFAAAHPIVTVILAILVVLAIEDVLVGLARIVVAAKKGKDE